LINNLIRVLPCLLNMRNTDDSFRHQGMRRNLVLELQQKGIQSAKVLEAIGKIPRHVFFESALQNHAYQDKAFPIGEGQTISQPYTVARQTELLEVKPGHKILEIGTGSGYQTAVLMELGATVFTIEYQPVLFHRTKKNLPLLGYRANFFLGDGSRGIPAFGPYDRIIVTAGAPSVPQPLIDQLKEGGILIIPAGESQTQEMLKIQKLEDGSLIEKKYGNFAFVPLKGSFGWA
jgi:protein-L-isoaspartate(D-aspartate) O-methyltransferase